MGTWSAGILSDDFTRDVYDEYIESFNAGKSPSVIRTELEQLYSSSIADRDEGIRFWLAIAQAQWTTGTLDSDILDRIRSSVENNTGLDLWAEAGDSQLKARKKVLAAFLKKISSSNPRPLRPRPRTLQDSIYHEGDCLALLLPNGRWGAALVIGSEHRTEWGFNILRILRFYGTRQPNLEVFKKKEWMLDPQNPPTTYHDRWGESYAVYAKHFRKAKHLFHLVGAIPLARKDKMEARHYAQWATICSSIQKYYASNRDSMAVVGNDKNRTLLLIGGVCILLSVAIQKWMGQLPQPPSPDTVLPRWPLYLTNIIAIIPFWIISPKVESWLALGSRREAMKIGATLVYICFILGAASAMVIRTIIFQLFYSGVPNWAMVVKEISYSTLLSIIPMLITGAWIGKHVWDGVRIKAFSGLASKRS